MSGRVALDWRFASNAWMSTFQASGCPSRCEMRTNAIPPFAAALLSLKVNTLPCWLKLPAGRLRLKIGLNCALLSEIVNGAELGSKFAPAVTMPWNSMKSGRAASPRNRILDGQACGQFPTFTFWTNTTFVQPSAMHIAHTDGALVEQAVSDAGSLCALMPSCVTPVASTTLTRTVATGTVPPGGRVIGEDSVMRTLSPPPEAHELTAGSLETHPLPPTGTNASLPGTCVEQVGSAHASITMMAPPSVAWTSPVPSGTTTAGVSLLEFRAAMATSMTSFVASRPQLLGTTMSEPLAWTAAAGRALPLTARRAMPRAHAIRRDVRGVFMMPDSFSPDRCRRRGRRARCPSKRSVDWARTVSERGRRRAPVSPRARVRSPARQGNWRAGGRRGRGGRCAPPLLDPHEPAPCRGGENK